MGIMWWFWGGLGPAMAPGYPVIQSHTESMNSGENSYASDCEILRNFDKDVYICRRPYPMTTPNPVRQMPSKALVIFKIFTPICMCWPSMAAFISMRLSWYAHRLIPLCLKSCFIMKCSKCSKSKLKSWMLLLRTWWIGVKAGSMCIASRPNGLTIKKVLRNIIRASFSQERMTYFAAQDTSEGIAKVINQSKRWQGKQNIWRPGLVSPSGNPHPW